MLSRASLFIFVATATVGIAIPWTATSLPKVNYKIPESMMRILAQDDSCIMPASFAVSDFLLWTPELNNTNSPKISFFYNDENTNIIDTHCQFNSSSKNVGPEGLTPRYACDNPVVEFIWDGDDKVLTVVEKACPESGPTMEASGVLTPNVTCIRTGDDSIEGVGTACFVLESNVTGTFTSLQPIPPS